MTLLAGVLPVLRGLGADLSVTLARAIRGTAATSTGRRLRQASIVAQLALSLALLVSAALVIQTFIRLRAVDPGFDAAGRMTLSYFAPRARYADAGRLVALVDRVREEIGRAPGVRAVGIAQALPFAPGVVWLQALTRDDPRGVANLGALPHVHYNVVSAGYAEALGVPTKAGRTFDATDTAGSLPVVVINEALARRFFPGRDPMGQSLWVGPRAGACRPCRGGRSSASSATRDGAGSTNRPGPKPGCRTRSRPAPRTSCARCSSCSTPRATPRRRCRQCGRRSPAPTPTCR